jgi:MFS family permease
VINAYELTLGGFLLLGGRIADLLGRRRIFIVSLGITACITRGSTAAR